MLYLFSIKHISLVICQVFLQNLAKRSFEAYQEKQLICAGINCCFDCWGNLIIKGQTANPCLLGKTALKQMLFCCCFFRVFLVSTTGMAGPKQKTFHSAGQTCQPTP